MTIISGVPTMPTPRDAPTDPRAAALAAAKVALAGGKVQPPDGWDTLTPEEQKRAVSLFNSMYGNVARRPGGYDVSKLDAFFGDPLLQRPEVWLTLMKAAAPFKATYQTEGPSDPIVEKFRGRLPKAMQGTPGTVYTQHTAQADSQQVASAINNNGRSAPHMKAIVAAAAKHGVPWQVLWGLLRKESNFDARAVGKNKNGSTDSGIAQINSIHKVPEKDALNPAFAIDWAAAKLKEGFAAYGDWSLAVLNYHRPRSAAHIANSRDGSSEAGWGAYDRSYVGSVFAGLEQLGFDATTETKLTLVGGREGGGAAGQAPKFAMPDPVAVRRKTADYLRALFFREPTEQELNNAVGLASGLVAEANAQASQYGEAANPVSNPFQTPEELQHPLPGARKSSSFGPRVHPVHGKQKQHSGTDWAAAEGTPIKAAVSGKVTFAGKKGGYGNVVIIKGKDGREYRYAHMSRLGATTGDEVIAGAAIGAVGQTGTATGPHLHFEIRQNGVAIDPETVMVADDDSPAPAPMGTGAITTPAALGPTPTDFDQDARLRQQVESMPEYRELYGNKPAGVSDQDYAAAFAGVGTEMLGSTTAANEAIRAGLSTGQAGTTAGVIAGDPRSQENKTFRQKMFEASSVFNALL